VLNSDCCFGVGTICIMLGYVGLGLVTLDGGGLGYLNWIW
jgi:hypothetical protein